MAGNQPKIAALARPKHQAVWSKANRSTVAIERSVVNAEPDQSQFQVRPLQAPLRSTKQRYVVVTQSTPSASNQAAISAGGAFDVGSFCSEAIMLLAMP